MIQGLGRRIFKTIGTLVLLGRLRSLGSPLLFWSASKSVRTFIDLNSIFRRFLLGFVHIPTRSTSAWPTLPLPPCLFHLAARFFSACFTMPLVLSQSASRCRRFLLGLPPGSPHSFSAISPAGCFFSGGFYVATFFPTIFFATIFFAITFCFWDSMSLKVMSG